MKKFFLGALASIAVAAIAPAQAADMPVKAPVYKAPVVAAYNWTGWYAGLNAGYSWGRSNTDVDFTNSVTGALLYSTSDSFSMDGWLGGLQGGYNWQKQNWVWGIEGDIQITGQKGDTIFRCPGGVCTTATFLPAAQLIDSSTLNQKLEWFGTLRLRGGMTVTPTVLAYLTGGLAVGGIKSDGVLSGFSGGAAVSAPFSATNTKVGWTVGAGVEGQISGRWTGKIEYLYIDFGTADFTALLPTNVPPLAANFSSHVTDNILRVGLNYHY